MLISLVVLFGACQDPEEDVESGDSEDTSEPAGAENETHRPSYCPPREDLPCDTPPPYFGEVPSPAPYSINGRLIPLPEGGSSTTAISEPGGANYIYFLADSFITFTPEGWLVRYEVGAEDADAFQPPIEALHEAANPVVVNEVVIPVPLGALYQPPIFEEMPEGWAGDPGMSPHLNVVQFSDSWISFDGDGRVIGDEVSEDDSATFAAVREALSEAAD